MSDDEDRLTREVILNLEHIVRALLPPAARSQPFSEQLIAEAMRTVGKESLILNMALVAALTSEKAAYRLRVVENTAAYPGGVPKIGTVLQKLEMIEAIQVFVDSRIQLGMKTEAAIAEAQAKFGMSRSSVFEHLKSGRLWAAGRVSAEGN